MHEQLRWAAYMVSMIRHGNLFREVDGRVADRRPFASRLRFRDSIKLVLHFFHNKTHKKCTKWQEQVLSPER
jgi:hypothetical protein